MLSFINRLQRYSSENNLHFFFYLRVFSVIHRTIQDTPPRILSNNCSCGSSLQIFNKDPLWRSLMRILSKDPWRWSSLKIHDEDPCGRSLMETFIEYPTNSGTSSAIPLVKDWSFVYKYFQAVQLCRRNWPSHLAFIVQIFLLVCASRIAYWYAA